LFEEVIRYEEFMVTLANNLLKDSIWDMVYRVSVGAALSTIDTATDIYVITTYYESPELIGQANVLISMISANIFVQLVIVIGNYKNKSTAVKLKEMLITLLFLRPAVDAYRVSTNHEDEGATVDSLIELIINKVSA